MSPGAVLRVQITPFGLLLAGTLAAAAADVWDDRPLRVVQKSDLHFPTILVTEGITAGKVRVVLEVDAAGRLMDALVTGYTRVELAEELQRNLGIFSFTPARQRGVPVPSRVEATFSFAAKGGVISMNPGNAASAHVRGSKVDPMILVVAEQFELDRPLEVVHQVAPQVPRKTEPPAVEPRVHVQFYIDAEGRPRMPAVLRATDEEYAKAAVAALAEWRFAPPRREGRPVHVRAVQEFVF